MQNEHICKMIKLLCKNKGISITTLLTECNLTKSFIYDLEKRSTSPSCAKITKVADYLDCSVDYLLGRTDVVEVNTGKPKAQVIMYDGQPYIAARSGTKIEQLGDLSVDDIIEIDDIIEKNK